jgi:hypothetical protein
LLALCAMAAMVGAYASARLSYADWLFRENTVGSVREAVRLDPGNGQYRAWLAELLENEGEDGGGELEAAAWLNPMDSRVWIREGLNAEGQGRWADAERMLLHAAEIDRLLEPRWTLMNFYLRRQTTKTDRLPHWDDRLPYWQNGDPFWRWARAAFAISYGDRRPLFDLCWRVRADASFLESNALPEDYGVQLQFMNFLLSKGRLDEAAAVAGRISGAAPAADARAFAECVEQLLSGGRTGAAVKLWNSMARRRLDARAGASLTNGSFEVEPSGLGFDWRVPATQGVAAIWMNDPRRMRFTFSGKEPDQAVLLSQVVPVDPARRYELRFEYRTWGIAPGSGIRMLGNGRATPDLASDEWARQSLRFEAGGRETGSLTLEYRRPVGVVRVEGTLDVRDVTLDFAP